LDNIALENQASTFAITVYTELFSDWLSVWFKWRVL